MAKRRVKKTASSSASATKKTTKKKKTATKSSEPSEYGNVRGASGEKVRLRGKTSGLKVSQAYKFLFESNEKLAAGEKVSEPPFKGKTKPLTDEQIVEWLKSEFGERGANNHLKVAGNRNAYLKGQYPALKKGEANDRVSNAYGEDGKVSTKKRATKKSAAKKPAAKKKTATKKKTTRRRRSSK